PAVALEIRHLPLDDIKPSPENPRRHFDVEGLNELAASLRVHGVLEPILVRPVDLRDWEAKLAAGKKVPMEIVAGERRWRAAAIAKLASIPAIVRPMSNAQALETMIVENLQPADQEKALAYCLTDNSWQATNGKPNLPKLLKENELVVSEKDLRKFLQSNIHRDLRRAPWDLADKDLVAAAGACDGCLKRDG